MIASSYVVPNQCLLLLADLVAKRQWQEVWQELNKTAAGATFDRYGGGVVNVLLAYWEEQGVQMPLSLKEPVVSGIVTSELGLQVCSDVAEALEALSDLSKLPIDVGELKEFYNAFTVSDWDQSGEAMKEAWQFVVRGLSSVKAADEVYMLFVG